MELKSGSVVRSKAGHDKGLWFAVLACEGDCVLLANGRQRTLEHPKRKKVIHIAATNSVLTTEQLCTNRKLKKALAQWNETLSEQGEAT
jgi:ribosomal protein L14E/L6E/L27E